jgi:hypothetical protein
MSQVNPVGGVVPPAANGVYLSADSILAYCSVRMNNLDSMIQSKMAEQENRSNTAKQWSQLQTILSGWHDITGNAKGQLQAHADMANALRTLWSQTKDPSLRGQIEAMYGRVTGRGLNDSNANTPVAADARGPNCPNGIDVINVGEVKDTDYQSTIIEPAKSGASAASQGMDLEMINIQSLVSQRQQAMQLTTQMLASFNEGVNKVLGNIRA